MKQNLKQYYVIHHYLFPVKGEEAQNCFEMFIIAALFPFEVIPFALR